MSSTSTSWTTQANTKAGASSTSTDSLTTGTLVADTLQLASNVIKASDGGSTITLNTDDGVTIAGDLTVSGGNITSALTLDSTLTVTNTTQLNNTLTVGVDDAGHDVKFFGNTASHYMLWDTSADKLIIASTGNVANLVLTSTDTDNAVGPGITLERIATGADNDALGKIDFYGRDDGDNSTLYARMYSQLLVAADGGEIGSMQFQVMTENASANLVKTGLWIKGSATNDEVTCNVPNGGIVVGQNSSVQGTLTLWDGAGGNTPGYMILYSPNGTANYIFCEDDGTLKRHTSAPTANSDGSEIGGQS